MTRALLVVGLLLAAGATAPTQDKQEKKEAPPQAKEAALKFVTLQTTAAALQGKKVKAAEVVSEAGPAQELANVLGAQGEPPVMPGKYFAQTLMIDLEGNQRLEAAAYFRTALPKGTKLTKLRPWGAFTAESGKKVLQLTAMEGEVQR